MRRSLIIASVVGLVTGIVAGGLISDAYALPRRRVRSVSAQANSRARGRLANVDLTVLDENCAPMNSAQLRQHCNELNAIIKILAEGVEDTHPGQGQGHGPQ